MQNFYSEQVEMNDILSIMVEGTIGHSTCAKKWHKLVLKMRRNEKTLEQNIISVYPVFVRLIKTHGV